MKLHHVGYLVANMEKSIRAFGSLGYVLTAEFGGEEIIYDALRDADICFLRQETDEGAVVELISPKSKESPVYGLLSNYKNSPYHLCFDVEDREAEIARLKENGWMIMQEDAPAVAIGGRHVTFLMNRFAGIMELVYDAPEGGDADEQH